MAMLVERRVPISFLTTGANDCAGRPTASSDQGTVHGAHSVDHDFFFRVAKQKFTKGQLDNHFG